MSTEKHNIECLECGKSYLYKFSSEEVKHFGIPSLEDLEPGKIFSGIVPAVICKNIECRKLIAVHNFRPYNKQ
ncbi:hypothetical protein LCGC14_0989230 [marine sediment metagenome]|uniref:Uncharacterized protein n=1 Tax=marine sediment metagenome TaxID=412755 RepID=A0A0F9N658_9ZZZZ